MMRGSCALGSGLPPPHAPEAARTTSDPTIASFACMEPQWVKVTKSLAMPAILSRASSSLKLPTSTPGIFRADASNASIPAGSGSGDRPGRVNDVDPSKIVIDQTRWPWMFWISAPCTVAPDTAPYEYVPPLTRMLLGGGSQLASVTVEPMSTLRIHASDDG